MSENAAGTPTPARPAPDGRAIVWCEGAFATPNGKTAHGLVRFTRRYEVLSVIDSTLAGRDAGQELDGRPRAVPIVADVDAAVEAARAAGRPATHFVIGLAPDGGRLPPAGRTAVLRALDLGLNVDSGLHDILSNDSEFEYRAECKGLRIRDVRKTPPRSRLHFFSGKIAQVTSYKVALLGTDSAVGKRTTAWMLVDALNAAGARAEMVGTGQTAWMQGVRHGIVMDCLINDFVSGEIEHAVWSAWNECKPDVIVIEGQGSLLNPAYPGGYEILAAGRPDGVVLQHAPARREYDGFPGWPLHPLETQIRAIELVSGKPVIGIALNQEHLDAAALEDARASLAAETGLPVCAPLADGVGALVEAVLARARERAARSAPAGGAA